MHFLPQTRHGISDFDCFSYCTSALAQMQLMQILASQQTVVSENDIDYFRVDSTPISFITFAFYSMIHLADCLRSLSSSKHCSLLCSHVIWLSVTSIVVFLFGLSSDRLGVSRVLDSCVRSRGHIHRWRRTGADGRWRFWRWSRESLCDFRLKLSYRKSENKPPFWGYDGLIPGSGWTWLPWSCCWWNDELQQSCAHRIVSGN